VASDSSQKWPIGMSPIDWVQLKLEDITVAARYESNGLSGQTVARLAGISATLVGVLAAGGAGAQRSPAVLAGELVPALHSLGQDHLS